MLEYLIEESPTDYSIAKLQVSGSMLFYPSHNSFSQSLARDNYCCLITGHYDMTSYDKYPEVQQIVNTCGYTLVATEAARIFPPPRT
jgi:hypothetical protein